MQDVSNSDQVRSKHARFARAHSYNVHHDCLGWYVIAPDECEPEDGTSLGFDGRLHFEFCVDAWAHAAKLAERAEAKLALGPLVPAHV